MESGDNPQKGNETDRYTVCEQMSELFEKFEEHKTLLTHPVITSFLTRKWREISSIFYLHLALYLTFACLFTAYALHEFGSSTLPIHTIYNNTNGAFRFNSTLSAIVNILKCVLLMLIVLLILWEILQISRDPRSYIKDKENWLEIVILSLAITIVIMQWTVDFHQWGARHLSAACIILIWAEFLLLLGRHPRWQFQ